MSHPFKTIEHRYIKPALRRLKPYSRVRYGAIEVYYKNFLDGGGSHFGQDFIPFFRARKMPPQARAFEWCAGPAFIGYSLLAHGLCDSLCLADINPAAVDAARTTARRNGLTEQVAVYHSDNLRDIPATERWNLVVSNPPHFIDEIFKNEIRAYDKDWHLHRAFFHDVPKFLAPDGVIVLQENNEGSTADTFADMIREAGLKTVFVHDGKPELTPGPHYYYIGIMREGDTPPAWAHP